MMFSIAIDVIHRNSLPTNLAHVKEIRATWKTQSIQRFWWLVAGMWRGTSRRGPPIGVLVVNRVGSIQRHRRP
jgi:hypothetical protein